MAMLGSRQTEKGETREEQSQEHDNDNVLCRNGDFGKELVLAGQTVHSAYYCHVWRRLREHVRRLRPELWQQKNWLLHDDNASSHTSFFTLFCFPD
jgi:hypothetical protein